MIGDKHERTDAYDVEMVKKYLNDFPQPSVGTMHKVFNPHEAWADEWAGFLKEPWTHKLKILRDSMPKGNVVLDGLPTISLRGLYVEHTDEAIELETCQVISISETEPYAEWIRFRCGSCREEWVFNKEEDSWARPKRCCDSPSIAETTNASKDSIDSQWLKIQELQNESSDIPQTLNCLLKGRNMTWTVGFHERVSLIGLLHFKRIQNPKTRETQFQKWFEVFGVRKIDADASIPLTDRDIDYIKSEMSKPGFYDKLVKSFAPHIWGMETFKEAILLVLASQKLPRPARLMMVTDPSLGKSELIQYTCSLVPNAQHTQMGRASGPGLTVISEHDKETGRRYIVRGAAAAAHKGLLCIDEMQMGDERDFMRLNEMLESGKVRYAMAGGMGYMDANCAMVMAANPHEGRFADEQALGEILKFMGNALPAFVSRINLILLKKDNASRDEEEKVARHMVRHNPNDPLYLARYQENWYDQEASEEVEVVFDLKAQTRPERFGTQWIKKIIKYVTNNIQVEPLSEEYEDMFVDYYMENHSNVASRVNKFMTKRFLRHNIVIAQYMARLQGQTKPDEQDIHRAIQLLEMTMSVAAFDPKTGEFDVNNFNVSRSERDLDKMNKMEQWVHGCHQAMKNSQDGKYFTEQELINVLAGLFKSKWTDGSNISNHIQKAMLMGKMMEKGGKYTWRD